MTRKKSVAYFKVVVATIGENVILEATSINVFLEKIRELLVFIDEILVFITQKFPESAAPMSEKLLSLKNILIQIQDQAEIK